MPQWNYYKQPKYELNQCYVSVWDDGNHEEEHEENMWYIIGDNKAGKYCLQNCKNPLDFITSISCWKVQMIQQLSIENDMR